MFDSFASRKFAFCTVLILVVAPCLSEAQEHNSNHTMRDWHDANGRKMTAALISSDGTTVTLQQTNGQRISVAVEKLSDSDQSYLKKSLEGERSELDVKSAELCEQIGKSYKGKGTAEKPKIAVVDFTDLEGGVSNLGRLLSEELISKLFLAGKFRVVERLLLNKTIEEHKLRLQGVVEPTSAKELGKLLGADAIVCGTLADVGDSARVNARLISTETGEVLSVAIVSLRRDKLTIGGGQLGGSGGVLVTAGKKVKLPYHEDFSQYKDGDTTAWGSAAKVVTGEDGRKWLAPTKKGQNPIGVDVDLPDNAYIELEYVARKLESKEGGVRILSGISLIDEIGAKYRIEWTTTLDMQLDGNKLGSIRGIRGISEYRMTFPGGGGVDGSLGMHYRLASGKIRLRKSGNSITVCREGDKDMTADVSDFKKFTRFEVDVYKGPNATIHFTNFKIGGAATERNKSKAPLR